MSEEAVHIRVTGKQLGIAITAFAVVLGSYPVANWFSPAVRSDPFTGSDGRELADRLDVIEMEVAHCQQRQHKHREAQAGVLAEIKAKTKSNEYLIKQCMRMTGQ